MTTPLDEYFAAIIDAAEASLGCPMAGRSAAVAALDRVGTRTATSYPTPSGTVVWCDPELVDVLSGVTGSGSLSTEAYLDHASGLGAEVVGRGNNRVLVGDAVRPDVDAPGASVMRLDPHHPDDLALLSAFVEACDEDDLDEAELELDELDEFIVAIIIDGAIAAYASGRPSEVHESFDDIGVITHADHRRQGLGALAVYEFVRQRIESDPSRRMLYRCDVTNEGSNAVAESLGFTLAHTIGAVRFSK